MPNNTMDLSNNPFMGNWLASSNASMPGTDQRTGAQVLNDRYNNQDPNNTGSFLAGTTAGSGVPGWNPNIIPYSGPPTTSTTPNLSKPLVTTPGSTGGSSLSNLGTSSPTGGSSSTPGTPVSTTYSPPPPLTNPYGSTPTPTGSGANTSLMKDSVLTNGGSTSTGATTQPTTQQGLSGPSTTDNMNQFLNNRNPFGTSGFDIANTVGQNSSQGAVDPRLYSYYNVQSNGTSESGSGQTLSSNNPRLLNDGSIINPNNPKDPFVQVGNLPPGRILDMSKVTYDPEFGAITNQSNINQQQLQNDPFSQYFPGLAVGLGIAGPAVSGALSGFGTPAPGPGIDNPGGEFSLPGGTPTPPGGTPPVFNTDTIPPVTPSTVPGEVAAPPVIPNGVPPVVPPVVPGGGGSSTLGNLGTRIAAGVGTSLATNAILGQHPTNTTTTGTGTGTNGTTTNGSNQFLNPDGTINWQNIIGAAGTGYSNNQSVQQFQNFLNQYINQSNPDYASETATRNQLLTNPAGYLASDPAFKQGSQDVSRQMAARGLTLSGNEMGALDDYGSKYISQKISDLNASMKPTSDLMSAAMRNAPEVFQAITNRNAANGQNASQIVSALKNSGAWNSLSKTVQDYLTGLGNNPIQFDGGSNDPLGYLNNDTRSPNDDPDNTGNGVWDGLLGSNPGP